MGTGTQGMTLGLCPLELSHCPGFWWGTVLGRGNCVLCGTSPHSPRSPRFLRAPGLGPPGQSLPVLLKWVKAGLGRGRKSEGGGEREGKGSGEGNIAQRLGGLSCCTRPGGKIGSDTFKQLQFLGKNYFLSPLGISQAPHA